MTGYVYLIVSDSGHYKVGFTKNDPRRRVAMLRTGTAEELALVGAVRGTIEDERAMHALLAPWRVTREWYSYCSAIAYFSEAVTPIAAGRPINHPLAAVRRQLGITQAELADQVGIHRTSVARIESRAQHPPLRTVSRIIAAVRARGCEITVDDFLPRMGAAA